MPFRRLGEPFRNLGNQLGVGLAGGEFSPSSISGLSAWYDFSKKSTLYQTNVPSTPVTADGQTIGYVTDLSGKGNHITQATAGNRPTYKTAIQNGLSVSRYAGSHWVFINPAVATYSQPFTIFYCGTSTVNNKIPFGGNGVGFYLNAGGNWSALFGALLNGTIAQSGFDIVSEVINGASSQIWVNAVSSVSGNAGATGLDRLSVGGYFSGASAHTGDIGEILFYSGALSAADRTAVQNYLNAKWSVF